MPNRRQTTRIQMARIQHTPPAITFADLAYELRQLNDCLAAGTELDIQAARFISHSVLAKLLQTPHAALHARSR